jgi:hypothetical protein
MICFCVAKIMCVDCVPAVAHAKAVPRAISFVPMFAGLVTSECQC